MYLGLSWRLHLTVKAGGFRERERGREKKAVMNIAKGRTKAVRACTLEH